MDLHLATMAFWRVMRPLATSRAYGIGGGTPSAPGAANAQTANIPIVASAHGNRGPPPCGPHRRRGPIEHPSRNGGDWTVDYAEYALHGCFRIGFWGTGRD